MYKEEFVNRHVGPNESEKSEMMKSIGIKSTEELINQIIPSSIRLKEDLKLDDALTEYEYLTKIKKIASKNKIYRSFIGMGYYPTATPSVILRNIFENPGWYTSYTPYQAEISQGRLEALLNFQTVVSDLTGFEISNCSLLDEATAAAEAIRMMYNCRSRQAVKDGKNVVFVDKDIFPQTLSVIILRAEPLGIKVVTGDYTNHEFCDKTFGAIVQYPAASGEIKDYKAFTAKAHEKEVMVSAICDLMSLVLITPPAEWGADIAVGSSQRFGIPMGFGGPSAAFLATKDEYKRQMPGRIIGVSVDKFGKPALRMAIGTREQHIKREKATSNICTAQALLAIMSGMYAVYHGPKGLTNIALNIYYSTKTLINEIKKLGYTINNKNFFDTFEINLPANINSSDIQKLALAKEINFFYKDNNTVKISTDELINIYEINSIIEIFAKANNKSFTAIKDIDMTCDCDMDCKDSRTTAFLEQKIFNTYHCESDMMRYIKMLENRDIALNRSMIPLGSCTMKLNPATTMLPLSWVEFNGLHPFVPADQAKGYHELISELENDLKTITGFAGVTLQPTSGAAGEHTGLMLIRAYHHANGNTNRNLCLIPASAHGTNPASAAMAGMDIITVKTDDNGNIDVEDFRQKAIENKDVLSCTMITYPSTHGVFEKSIKELVEIVHSNGGLVYMDGANMNAQIGFTNPGFIGADVCHLNLHKSFAGPHGGGGPGVGPVCVNEKLLKFLPKHCAVKVENETGKSINAVSSSPYGSAMILPINHSYIRMLGAEGLKKSTEMAIFNANYIVASLKGTFEALYTDENGHCAHETILDVRKFKDEYGIEAGDIARRLMDFGYHAPTLSFPVHETLMIEPTESESKVELDKFIEAMKIIKQECEDIKSGKLDAEDNPLKNAPHTQFECTANEWNHKYSREKAAFPAEWVKENKFWPYVGKIDGGYGDRNLVAKSID